MGNSTDKHWDHVYSSTPVEQLGWYEDEPGLSLEFIERCPVDKDEAILDVGAGATKLVDCLIERNYRNICALDISEVALQTLRARLGAENASRVKWVIDDITNPTDMLALKDIAIWHDRALLHFLTEDEQRQAYRSVLKQVVKPGGYVIIAAFSKEGATRCSGLDVKRYDAQSLAAFLGGNFKLKDSLNHQYQMPSGDVRPYVYTRFKKKV